jgi:ribonuclease HII
VIGFRTTSRLIGIDEAGRGCLAGPVVAGACVFSQKLFESSDALAHSALINDSKQLSAESRESQFTVLESLRAEGLIDFAVASGSVAEIAEHNILGATRLAMQRAIEQLAKEKDEWSLPHMAATDPLFQAVSEVKVIVDGRPFETLPICPRGRDQRRWKIALYCDG